MGIKTHKISIWGRWLQLVRFFVILDHRRQRQIWNNSSLLTYSGAPHRCKVGMLDIRQVTFLIPVYALHKWICLKHLVLINSSFLRLKSLIFLKYGCIVCFFKQTLILTVYFFLRGWTLRIRTLNIIWYAYLRLFIVRIGCLCFLWHFVNINTLSH